MPSPGTTTLRVLLRLLSAPHRYRLMDLAGLVGLKDRKAIKNHIQAIEAAGIEVSRDNHHRYAVLPQRGFKELRYLSPLSDQDKAVLKNALDYLPEAEARILFNKLETLYDFQQLGLEALRRPQLEKIDVLETALREKRRVVLINYRSRNSNSVRDRKVEPFGMETESGMVRAYDIQNQRTAHFLLGRMDRVRLLDEPWQYAALHYHKAADAFQIVDDQSEMVHLILEVSAYNDLIERHPRARQFIRTGTQPDTYDFQGRINAKFIGLTSYLLANWQHVEVLGPEKLREHLRTEIAALRAKYAR